MSVRQLRRTPGLALTALISLALSIGTSTLIFSFVQAMILKPLPFHAPGALVSVSMTPMTGGEHDDLPVPLHMLLRDASGAFEAVGGYDRFWPANLGPDANAGEPATRLLGHRVSASMFATLGVQPLLGRWYRADEDVFGAAPTVLLGEGLWRRRFAADPAIVGTSISIDGVPVTVLGVMPSDFSFFDGYDDFFAPFRFSSQLLQGQAHWIATVARLRYGTSLEQARSELQSVFAEFAKTYPGRDTNWRLDVRPLEVALIGTIRHTLLILQLASLCLLLISSANLAALLIARASTRSKEVGLRLALGDSRRAIIRQSLAESLLLSLSGGVIGTTVAAAALPAVRAITPVWFPRLGAVSIDVEAVAFAFAVSILTGIVFGVLPAVHISRFAVGRTVTSSLSARVTVGRGARRTMAALVVSQIAVAFVLLILGGLLVMSFSRLHKAKLGLDPASLLIAEIRLPLAAYTEEAGAINGIPLRHYSPEISVLFDRTLDVLRGLPGIGSVAGIDEPPFTQASDAPFLIEGREVTPSETNSYVVDYHWVTRDYFTTVRTPLVRGRDFTSADTANASWVVVINQKMVRQFWADRDPVGARIRLGWSTDERPREVVGVVGDVRRRQLDPEARPTVYLMHRQQLARHLSSLAFERTHMTFVMRSAVPAGDMAPAIRASISQVLPAYPVFNIRDLEGLMRERVQELRYYTVLLVFVGLTALTIASVGISGVLSNMVSRQMKELGIRSALGASPGRILWTVILRGLTLIAAGLGAGLVTSLVVSRVLIGLLWGVSSTDGLTSVLMMTFVAAVGIASCLGPALRAARVDPVISLRAE